jgi:hypothetical protein
MQEAAMSQIHEPEVHKHISMEKARSGETTGRMRIVLIASSILAIVALGIVLVSFMHPAAQS